MTITIANENIDELLKPVTAHNSDVPHNELFTRKQSDIQRHIQHTRQEFIGKPEVCAKVMEHIVYIRRKRNLNENLKQFELVISQYIDVLCEHLTTRWLLSILDTLAVHGSDNCRAPALAISTLVNLLIISDTVLAHQNVTTIDKKAFDPYDDFFKLEYGCMMFNTDSGDNFSNLLRMINLNVERSPVVKKIWLTIFNRIQNTNNMITKLRKIHSAPKGGHRFY